ncbi:MAG: SPFH domain-containing protein, partial [Verrucomicrobiota bacterium]|nr:SPFH domain-containing protein [Verrucomicrobiota bacterium]
MNKKKSFKAIYAFVFSLFALALPGLVISMLAESDILFIASLASSAASLSFLVTSIHSSLQSKKKKEEDCAKILKDDSNELFDSSSSPLDDLKQTIKSFKKYFLPIFSVLLGLLLLGGSFIIWQNWSVRLEQVASEQPLKAAACCLPLFFMALLGGSYFSGYSRENTARRWFRPGAAWLLFSSGIYLLACIALVFEQFHYTSLDYTLARMLLFLLLVLGIEQILNVIVDFYRPKSSYKDERPVYESRLLTIFTEPGGIAKNIAASLDYQFGFKASDTWFYRFCEGIILPLIILQLFFLYLMTCFVFIDTDEGGIRERLGKVVSRDTLEPGLYMKLPWPFAQIRKYKIKKIQKISIGYKEKEENGKKKELDKAEQVILWTKTHYEEETNFAVANKVSAANRIKNYDAVPVSFITVNISVFFCVNDLYSFLYKYEDSVDLLKEISTNKTISYLAGVDFFEFLASERREASEEIRRAIQAKVNIYDLGIKITFVALQSTHPPTDVGDAFEKVIAAQEEKETKILKAEAYKMRKKPIAESTAFEILQKAKSYKYE